jgi:ABC-type lipoprotein release transport system permease subunit
MRTFRLIQRSLSYYWPTHLAVILGVAIAVAVLSGALLVGDSVRSSLRELLVDRLGNADYVISGSYYREQLARDVESASQFASRFDATCPLIALEGLVIHQENKRRASSVLVYGVDDRFWRFHGQDLVTLKEREALLSPALARELGIQGRDSVLLRVEKPSAIPSEFLQGRRENQGHTLRFNAQELTSPLAEFTTRPRQGDIRALFVSLRQLQKQLGLENKVNTILVAARKPIGDWRPGQGQLEDSLQQAFQLEDLGINLRLLTQQQCLVLETQSTLINQDLEQAARSSAHDLGLRTSSILTYLANILRSGQHEVPYSLVTALDEESFSLLKKDAANISVKDERLPAGKGDSTPLPLLLNDWAAKDLQTKIGDHVSMEYYVWLTEGRLITRSANFRLDQILPLKGSAIDRDLVPAYPGITESENISDWDPPFPMDLKRIRPRDEAYWHEYKTTPKAYLQLDVGQALWQSRFGRLSSIRFFPQSPGNLHGTLQSYRTRLRSKLNPLRTGLSIYPVKGQGLEAAQGTTDFGEYFLYFSFFLVVSALLLTVLFFRLGVEQRLHEIGLLRALGFSNGKIVSLFLWEGLALAVMGSLLGLVGALAFGKAILWGLSHWWIGAVGTTRLVLHLSPSLASLGAAGGILSALICISWTIRSLARRSPRNLLSGAGNTALAQGRAMLQRKTDASVRSVRARFTISIPALVSGLAAASLLVGACFNWIVQVAGFFGAGTLLLVACLLQQSYRLKRGGPTALDRQGWRTISRLGFHNVRDRPARSILCVALIACATFIIVALDAFRREGAVSATNRKSGTGGYSLLADSSLPLFHDLNGREGRTDLSLDTQSDLVLQHVTFTRFRVRTGDDTSCLNLYQARNPRILGAPEEFIQANRFAFQASLAKTSEEKINPWLLLDKQGDDGTIPVIADANSITYGLHRKLGDRVELNTGSEHSIQLRLVAALADSLFQSELLMSERNFVRLFPYIQGYRFFLLETAEHDSGAVTGVLELGLSDFGFDVVPTTERLAGFHRVENTYLSTFQSLGTLGLLLGTLGLSAVLLRNVLERRRELALLRAVGYTRLHLAVMILAENVWLLFQGLLIGTICALVAVTPTFLKEGRHLSPLSIGFLLVTVLMAGLLASILATATALRSPLLPVLRGE